MKWINMDKYNDYPKPLRKHKYPFIYAMILPSIISFLVFYVYVNAQSIVMAFQQMVGYDVNGKEQYIWTLNNFKLIYIELFQNAETGTSLLLAARNTMILFSGSVFFCFPMGAIIAYYLWKKISGYKFFRSVFYLPSILSSVVMVIIYKNIVSPNGLFGEVFFEPGSNIPALLRDSKTAIWMVLIYNLWIGFSGSYIILTGALMRIPTEITDAAKLDGANAFTEFIHICVPLCWPTLYMIIISTIAGILNADGPILLLTNGAYDTTTLGFWSYMQVIVQGSYEYPAAVGIVMTCVVAPIAITVRKLLGKVYQDVEF